MRPLGKLHPITAAFYFCVAVVMAVSTPGPSVSCVMLAFGAILYTAMSGVKAFLKSLRWSLPLLVIITLSNPIFVHKGMTVLFLINETPVTLEAVAYGAYSAVMICSAFYWFSCLGIVLCDDKIVCLLGRKFPKTALLLSMTLNFVPRLSYAASDTDDAQTALGLYDTESLSGKIKAKLGVFSALVTQSLEGSIETADSMMARGYALPGRHSYSRYVFTVYDGIVCVLLAFIALISVAAGINKESMVFYPKLSAEIFDKNTVCILAAAISLSLVSIIPEVNEKLKWHCLK